MNPLSLMALAGCTWIPPVDTGLEPPDTVVLSGTLVASDGEKPQGPTLIARYQATDPPPPAGFGRPADLAAVGPAAWAAADGMRSAPWSMTGVTSGTWLLTALTDEDGDFNPFFDFTAGATCGDRTGAYVADAASSTPQPITVFAPGSLEHIPILLGAPLTTERPVFTLGDGGVITQPSSLDSDTPQIFTLEATGVEHPLLQVESPGATGASCPAQFQVIINDLDADGSPDPHNNAQYAALGLHDLWPKVYLFFRASLDGAALAEGESWVSEAVVQDAGYLDQGYSAGSSFPVSTLPVVFLPAALHTLPGGSTEEVLAPDLPTGFWGIAVFMANGQTWITPNQLADETVAATLGVQPDPGQAAQIELH